jgi:hypothetical protein
MPALEAIQPCRLQSSPLHFEYIAPKVSSILGKISGMLHSGYCTGPVAYFPSSSQSTQNISLSMTFLIWGIKKKSANAKSGK